MAYLAGVAVVVLLAALAAFANTAIGYVPAIAAAALLALGLVYLQLLKRSLRFTERGPNEAARRGEVPPFALVVRNGSILPAPRIEATFRVSDAFSSAQRTDRRPFSLPPRAEKSFDLGVRFDHLGFFEVGIERVRVFDPFGVFSSARFNQTRHRVVVVPKLVDLASVELSEQSLQESSKNIKTFINDGMDYSTVRDYRWGDPMKSIHWKLSSKSEGEYYTRLYETPSTPGLAVFLDFECDEADPERVLDVYDAMVESALSVERYAATAGFDTELLFVDARGETQRARGPLGDGLDELMGVLPRMRPGSGKATLDLVRRVAASPTCPSNLVVCTANATDELVSVLLAISGPLHAPYLVAVCDEERRAALRRHLGRLGEARVGCAVVSRASDLRVEGA